jgi:CheY-like chemotaxis protein/predicted Ser/Thr protein kinase
MTANKDILLIHRDRAFVDKIVPVIQGSGYTVHKATGMREALSNLAGHPVGLIVCDKELDDIKGIDFLGFIKKDPLRENIPFMFLVSQANQFRPAEAFALGAADYLVYPLDARMLVGRIGDAYAAESQAKPKGQARPVPPERPSARPAAAKPVPAAPKPAPAASKPAAPAPLTVALPTLNLEVSRDGVIWMPSRIKAFTEQSIAVQTSLFGKAGVALMVRFKLPEGNFVVKGHIKSIDFKDFQKPADIDIAVVEGDAWRRIFKILTQGPESAPAPATPAPAAVPPGEAMAATVALAETGGEGLIDGAQLQQNAAKKKAAYDIRFYNSLIGKQLDNYRVISLIGAGSMGGVLQGWDVALEREVALKIISFELSSKEEFREMFIKEARVISKLNHQNIAQIYNIGISSDILYYAMEFIEGVTLKEMIAKERKLDLGKGLKILTTVCKAMEVVYQNSVVHRDIKPANIMVNRAGVVKLLDFGVAHSKEAKTGGKRLIAGTPLYMSPEQIAGLTLDHKSDMYSLGATFYHAFCGAPPFEANEIKAVLDMHLNECMTPLCQKERGIPIALSGVIEKMMAKDPTDRYPTFRVVIEALELLSD